MTTTVPFAMLIGEGWRRETVADALSRVRSGEYLPRENDGHGERMLAGGTRRSISVDRACHEPGNDAFDPDRTRDFTIGVLSTMLLRSDEEHIERITIADRALDLAARLSGPAEGAIRSGEINAVARTVHASPAFGAVDKSRDGWKAVMRADHRRRDLPLCLCVDVSFSRMTIWCRSRVVHGVKALDTVDPLERLRMEAELGDVLSTIRAMDTA